MMRPTTFLIATLFGLMWAGPLVAEEWEESSPYYEDDGWLDISEWFDGNDYNPTDEKWGRWDDEIYDASDDATSTDRDSDWTWYGYRGARDDNDWFYDYYDPGVYHSTYDFDYYPYTSRYYDYDNDGIYDAYFSYADWDRDGVYESVDYYSFTDRSTDAQQKKVKDEALSSSKQRSITGTIQQVKEVQTRDQKHLVVRLRSQEGQTVTADLGRVTDRESLNLREGNKLTAKGPMVKVGQQNVLMATSLESQGKRHQIDRQRTQLTGKVVSTRKVDIRGRQNVLAIVDSKNRGEIAVDLGPADRLEVEVRKGDQLWFTGVPVKVQDRRLMMAQSVWEGDRWVSIQRHREKDAARTSSAPRNQDQGRTSQRRTVGYDLDSDGRADFYRTVDNAEFERLRRAREQSMASDRTGKDSQGMRTFSGRLKSAQSVTLDGQERGQNLVRITTSEGQIFTVNLGSQTRLGDLDLEQGDRIRIEGRPVRVDQQEVIKASTIEVNGEATRIGRDSEAGDNVYATPSDSRDPEVNRDDRSTNDRARNTTGNRDYTFRGTLEAFHRDYVPGSNQKSTFVKMWLADGEVMTIDLGPKADLAKLGLVGLADDERIVINGTTARAGDRTVLRAESISIDGQRTQLRQTSDSTQNDKSEQRQRERQ